MKYLSNILFLSIISIILFGIISTQASEVNVLCGGYIKPSPELKNFVPDDMDYTQFKIHLVSKSGHTVESTEPAPHGYFVLPVYEKGRYSIVVDGPEGWSITEKVEKEITEDGMDCDVDFEFTGFSLTGNVQIHQNFEPFYKNVENDLSGIIISLISKNSDKRESALSVMTDHDGHYTITNVHPGQYYLRIQHPTIVFDKNMKDLDIKWGNVEAEPFVVTGFNIEGIVKYDNQNGEPAKGVDVLLFSEDIKKLEHCPKKTDLPKDIEGSPLCVVTTDEEGKFKFSNLPSANYRAVPFFRDEYTTFDVIPSEVKFTLTQSFKKFDPFYVKGFSLKGRVLDYNGRGVSGVKVVVEGTETSATTDNKGYYRLEQLTTGTYDISASKPHYVLSELKDFKISPNVKNIPDLLVEKYQICGSVRIPVPPAGIKVGSRKITLGDAKTKEIIKTTLTDVSGNFYFDVDPGLYEIAFELSDNDIERGLIMTQTSIQAEVIDEPITDIYFDQKRLTVRGRVQCIGVCSTEISVALESKDREDYPVMAGLGVGNSADSFMFNDVAPGEYKITIDHDKWCWEQNQFDIIVDDHVNDIKFIQTGIVLKVESSHQISIETNHKGEKISYDIMPGENKICLTKPGSYKIIPKGCFGFEKSSYDISTDNLQKLSIKVVSYLVEGTIEVEDKNKIKEIEVVVKSEEGKEIETIKAKKEKENLFKYQYYIAMGKTLYFEPKTDADLLFYPRKVYHTVENDKCQFPLTKINARPSLRISGKINPPIEGVEIHVLFADTEEYAQSVILTDKDGKYQTGPLYDDRKYKLVAEKEGFNFREISPGVFKTLKLSTIKVNVKDKSDNSPVTGVLLSLSGGEGYRNNNATGEDGSQHFINLYPGSYYLKPLLKEYVFDQPSLTLKLEEGKNEVIDLYATRVAYSCFGKVSSITNIPEQKFVVIATNKEMSFHEEAKTDENGLYRIRGLQPKNEYNITIQPTSRVSQSVPETYNIYINNEDVHNINFISFRSQKKFDLSGIVHAPTYALQSLTLLLNEKESGKEINSFNINPSGYYLFTDLQPKTYTLTVKSNLPSHTYKYSDIVVDVELNKTTNLNLDFNPELISFEEELGNASFFSLLLIALAIVIAFYYDVFIQIIKNSTQNKKIRKEKKWTDSIHK